MSRRAGFRSGAWFMGFCLLTLWHANQLVASVAESDAGWAAIHALLIALFAFMAYWEWSK